MFLHRAEALANVGGMSGGGLDGIPGFVFVDLFALRRALRGLCNASRGEKGNVKTVAQFPQ